MEVGEEYDEFAHRRAGAGRHLPHRALTRRALPFEHSALTEWSWGRKPGPPDALQASWVASRRGGRLPRRLPPRRRATASRRGTRRSCTSARRRSWVSGSSRARLRACTTSAGGSSCWSRASTSSRTPSSTAPIASPSTAARPGLTVLYDRHTPIHHRIFVARDMAIRDRREFALVLLPWFGIVAIFAMTAPFTVALWFFERNLACLFVATTMFYVLSYEWLHLSYHLPRDALHRAARAHPASSPASRDAPSSAPHAEVELQRDRSPLGLGPRDDAIPDACLSTRLLPGRRSRGRTRAGCDNIAPPMTSFETEVAEMQCAGSRALASPGIRRLLHGARGRRAARDASAASTPSRATRPTAFHARLRQLFDEKKCITTFGPYSPGQAVAMKRAGHRGHLRRRLGDERQGLADEDPGPDLASYPLSRVPDEAAAIVRALLTADRNQFHARARMTDGAAPRHARGRLPPLHHRRRRHRPRRRRARAQPRPPLRRGGRARLPHRGPEARRQEVRPPGRQGARRPRTSRSSASAPRASSSTSWACPASSWRAPTPSRRRCSTAAATSATSRSSSARRTSTCRATRRRSSPSCGASASAGSRR